MIRGLAAEVLGIVKNEKVTEARCPGTRGMKTTRGWAFRTQALSYAGIIYATIRTVVRRGEKGSVFVCWKKLYYSVPGTNSDKRALFLFSTN